MKFEFYMKRASINLDDIFEVNTRYAISTAIKLSKAGLHENAVRALPELEFEWIWSNCDKGSSDIFVNNEDFTIKLTPENSTVRCGAIDDYFLLTLSVMFDMEVKEGVTEEEVEHFINEQGGLYCAYVGGGWSYLEDDGISLHVLTDDNI